MFRNSKREPAKISSLPLAVRVYPEPEKPRQERQADRSLRHWRCPDAMLVFDTETRTDATQRLMFGSYRLIVAGQCREEGLFYADDLPAGDLEILKNYAATHSAEVAEGNAELRLLTLSEFLDKFYRAAYKSRCLLVGFNLPFDLSRIAGDVAPARGRFAGGFSLGLWFYTDKLGRKRRHQNRPRIGIKQIDSKRALKGFTGQNNPDKSDLIPDGSATGAPEEGYKFRGHFVDLRTLAFALTDQSYSLESACEAFGVEHLKQRAARHGEVTEEYIDYNRRDVLATSELAVKLLEEYEKHGLLLQVTKAYSPASIGKAYLREMGIDPILKRQPDFSKKYLGYAQSAFFGGRTSAHIRKVPVPVVYTDFLSMYPTVNGLMQLWRFVIAREIKVVEHCEKRITRLLEEIKNNPACLFDPHTWERLTAFVKVIPDGDILPTRSKYNAASNDWQVAVNYLYAGEHQANKALWFSLPDVVASVLLTGTIPQIVDAFRIEAHGILDGLKPTKLYGAIETDPRKRDFFKRVIEERKRLGLQSNIAEAEKKKLDKALKVLANATSYGIYAEMNRKESDHVINVKCHGIDAQPFTCSITHPDDTGEYCFPPMASLITGAARLMLALLEDSVTKQGGTYAMEDTDSMAIVATENGGLIPCPGGSLRTKNNREAIEALSWKEVKEITDRFAALSPYSKDAVPGSILKIEEDNSDPKTNKQRQLYCLAISAKRYALFIRNSKGDPAVLRDGINNNADRWSEHGLGHLLNPTNLHDEDRNWIAQAWLNIIRKAHGLSAERLGFEDSPAVGRITVSSPALMRPLTKLNDGKKYEDQVKPFNFLLSCHVSPLGHPIGVDPKHFHLITPYEPDPCRWTETEWIDQYTGKTYKITTTEPHGNRHTARVKTCGDVLIEYEFHAETKNADSEGNPSGKRSMGILQRRHVQIKQIKYIGKESNVIEDVEAGLAHSEADVYTYYPDPRRDEWETQIRPALRRVSLRALKQETGFSRRILIYWRTGKRKPHRRHQQLVISTLRRLNPI
jgi:hypothetical protein